MLTNRIYNTSTTGIDNHKKPTPHQNYENNDCKQGMGLS
jgi:hypothetical protein